MSAKVPARTLAFVILTWNSEVYIRACVESVLSLGYLCDSIYIVDNGSMDGTLEILAELESRDERVRVLPQKRNLGTTASRNIALRMILDSSHRSSYVCVLDSDTVISRDAIDDALDVLEVDSSIGVIGPTLVGGDGAIQITGRALPSIGIKLLKAMPIAFLQRMGERMEMPDSSCNEGLQDVGYLISACWISRTSVWDKVGLLDENIFYAPEDVDWCLRCHENGLRVVRRNGPSITHYYQRISKKKLLSSMNWQHLAGLAYYFKKHGYFIKAPRFYEVSHEE